MNTEEDKTLLAMTPKTVAKMTESDGIKNEFQRFSVTFLRMLLFSYDTFLPKITSITIGYWSSLFVILANNNSFRTFCCPLTEKHPITDFSL